jgi:cell division protein FtsB
MMRKIIYLLALAGVGIILYSFIRQIYDALEVGKRVDLEIEDLGKLQKQNLELKKKLAQMETVGFLEQQARDKLNMAREGETVFIIPQEVLDQVLKVEKVEKVVEPNWKGWLRLFWH